MLNSKLNAKRGFHPRRCGFPDAITPEQVLRHHRSAQGRHGGTGTVPSFIRTSILNFISREKEFYRANIFTNLKYLLLLQFFVQFLLGDQGNGRSNVFPCFMAILAIARSWIARPVESKRVMVSGLALFFLPVTTSPRVPAMSVAR